MNDSLSQQNQVEALAEEFLERRRQGERPTIAEYAARYPELADEIRACFPALLLVEDLKPDPAEATGPQRAPGGGSPLERLGDYRVLREVGRGGMGVVYEAEQVSLGRHVALKVLPAHALLDPRHLQRFQREARAAARLHHTNIVPVFGVGEDGGLHYYVMQFIQGQGLDQVLDELRRLRRQRNGREVKGPERSAGTEHVSAAQVAEALLTGRFSRARDAAPPSPLPLSPAGERAEKVAPLPPGERGGGEEAAPPTAASLVVAPSASDSSTTVRLPGQPEHTTLSESGRGYWQSVARIGVQVAEALAHAHGQGVLHRDIKPSNLLLDTHGTVWVTDFGLAKASDSDGLTQTGDIVGTLRYMAPERFAGQSDPRSDLYGLGITLYELLTLRPAFAEADRNKLLGRVLHEEPPRPRRFNPEVPRDLETVVLKAIAKEPKQRYASAAELAEDLRRFLADRPVQARRASALERLGRWARRNPALAAALGAVAALLLTVTLVTSLAYWRLHGEQEATRHQLYGALVAQARASRRSRTAGQRFDSLATLVQATQLARQLHLPAEDFRELRNEAIAALALPDMRVAKEWDGWPEGTTHVDFDDQLERYVRLDRQGNITVRRVADDAEVCHFTSGIGDCWPCLSRDGRFLLVHEAPRCKVWELGGQEPRLIRDEENFTSGAFSPDSRQLALAHGDGSISLYNLPAGGLLRRLDAGPVPRYMAFRPDGQQLALACPDRAQVRDLQTGQVCAEFQYPDEGYPCVAWHPDGKTLAAVGGDRIIRLWDVATGKQTVQLEGFKNGGIGFTFNRAGDLLASTGWEGVLRLWDPRTGQQLFQVRGEWPSGGRFGPDDRLLGAEVKDGKLRLCEVAAGPAYRTLVRDPALGKGRYGSLAVSPRGRLLAAAMDDGLGFWDFRTGAPLAFVPRSGDVGGVVFEASGVLLTGGSGPFRWPVRPDPASPGLLRIGPPQKLPLAETVWTEIACSADGRVVASAQRWGALVWHRDRPGELIQLGPQEDTRLVSVSPDGRWVATGSQGRGGAKVWDAATGRLVKDLVSTQARVPVRFSPDGKWLATAGGVCRLWAVGSWQEGPSPGVTTWAVAFSPDGRVLAVETGEGVVRLVDPDTGREYARLEDPNQDRARQVAFSPDGTQLVVNGESQWLHAWDLRAIRAELTQRNLDWDLRPYPPAADPPDAPPLRLAVELGWLRGEAPAAAGHWDEAAAAYDQAVEQFPQEWESWYHAALVHLLRGDADGYRRLCTRALERFDATDDPLAVEYLAWAGALDAEAKVDPARLLRLAERAAGTDPKTYVHLRTLGAALLRAGQTEAAIARLTQAVDAQQDSPTARLLLAVAYQRLGQTAEARSRLRQAQEWIERVTPKGPAGVEVLPGWDTLAWTERLSVRQLLREAEAQVGPAPK
jgi:serine/threonine protein kinase/WD40 repeat protein/Flp pilus assembly protein TadD